MIYPHVDIRMMHTNLLILVKSATCALLILLGSSFAGQAVSSIGVADAALDASFYSDASCLLTIDKFVQSGKTVIDADVDELGSRMLIHCDTEDGRRLTLLARGDSLNVAQRVPLLSREEITEGEYGMIAWLTRSGVHYTDDSAPRRYVIGGSVKLRKSPPMDAAGSALNSSRQSFASVNGVLEPIVKSDGQKREQNATDSSKNTSEADTESQKEIEDAPTKTAKSNAAPATIKKSIDATTGNREPVRE